MPAHRRRRPYAQPLVVMATLVAALTALLVVAPSAAAASAPSGLKVSGNRLVDGGGTTVVLRGVNRSGTEYQCIHGYGIFDGPSDDASIAAMAGWRINAVRVPLNEDCWLAINGANAAYSGSAYRSAIQAYVQRLHAAGLVAILDLHWSAAGGAQAQGQQNMPDADHAPAFWTSVASTFAGDSSSVFDLYNEPHDVSWACWRDGGDCGIGYQVAGMQGLVNTVRATGAKNPILLGGLEYANDLRQWNAYRPTDSTGNLMASWHSYNFNRCITSACWDSDIAPIAASVPLVTGEIGENDCAHGYVDGLMGWLDAHQSGYLGWGWDTFDCGGFPALVSSYDGTPTAYGVGLRDHLRGLTTTAPPTTTSTAPPTSTAPTTSSAPPTSTAPTTSSAPPTSTAPTTSSAPPTGTAPSTTAPTGGAGLTVTPTAVAGSAPWWWEDRLDLSASAQITAMTVTVSVPRTAGLNSAGLWTNGPGGALTLTQTTDPKASTLTYRIVLNAGKTLPAGQTLEIGSDFSGNGTPHRVSGDTYVVTVTAGGRQVTSSGHF